MSMLTGAIMVLERYGTRMAGVLPWPRAEPCACGLQLRKHESMC